MREHLPEGEKAVEHDGEEHKELERTMKELEGCDASDHRSATSWQAAPPPDRHMHRSSARRGPSASPVVAHRRRCGRFPFTARPAAPTA
jgi:hypothetical protein